MKKPMPFGKYYLLDRINVGGMAEVFKAKMEGVEGFERLVAVKRILPSIAEDEEFIKMFIDEAKIAVQLTHQNIAQIIDLGKVGDAYFIAMEYIHGRDLRATFDRGKRKGEIVPLPMSCFVMMKVCEGLDYAHNKRDASGASLNLVHRDVSPQNILMSFDGETKIIDFGIAKAANKAAKTQAGILKGKFGYMSPEQVRGLPLDRRSDVFSCGIILYELVTGERLFIGESDFSTLEKVRNVEIMPPTTYNRQIPEELERIVLKALAKEKEDRYQSAMDLHDDLQSFMYTIESFFSQKDLTAFMRKAFPEEFQAEGGEAPAEGGGQRASKLPPPRASKAPPPRAGGRASALPPPPRASTLPPPKKTIMGMPAPQISQPPAAPAAPEAPPPPPAPPPPVAAAPAAPPPLPAPPPIMMPAAPPPVMPPSGPGPAAAPPAPLPPAPVPPAPTPPKPGAPGEGVMEWDDEEMATQIYDTEKMVNVAAGKAANRIDTSGLSDTAAPVPAKSRPPGAPAAPALPPAAAAGPMSMPMPMAPPAPPPRSKAPMIAAAIIALAVIVALFVVFRGGGDGDKGKTPAPADAATVAVADAGSTSPGPGPNPSADAAVAPPAADAAAPVAQTKEAVVILAEDLKAATITVDGQPQPWARLLKLNVPANAADGAVTLRIEWTGKQCKTPAAGLCPEWRVDATTESLEITGADFTVAPYRVALQGTLLDGFSLFIKTSPPEGQTGDPTFTALPVDATQGTPAVLLLPGAYTLVVRKEGFTDFELPALTVPEDLAAVQPLPLPVLVTLEVRSTPAEARVLLARGTEDAAEVGVTGENPVRVLVDRSQSYKVRVLKNGFKPFEQALAFADGQNAIALAPELRRDEGGTPVTPPRGDNGKLTVITQPWTMVYVDNRRIRQTPLINYELPAGRHTLVLLNNEAGIRKTEVVIVQAGRTTTIRRTQDQLR